MAVNERFRARIDVSPGTAAFYAHVVEALDEANVPFLLGGAFAYEVYTDIGGRTKDLDLFLHPRDVGRALSAMSARGYETVVKAGHWLAKILLGHDFVDVIFGSGNGITPIDDAWFTHARHAEVLGREVRLIPIEEMLWSKSFIAERERYDGADVAHLIRVAGRTMDWRRLVDRYGTHWRVLLAHLVLFDEVYPSDRGRIPDWVRADLLARAATESQEVASVTDRPVCYGTLLSRAQFLPDVEALGYLDGRVEPFGLLSEEDVAAETLRLREELARANGHH